MSLVRWLLLINLNKYFRHLKLTAEFNLIYFRILIIQIKFKPKNRVMG